MYLDVHLTNSELLQFFLVLVPLENEGIVHLHLYRHVLLREEQLADRDARVRRLGGFQVGTAVWLKSMKSPSPDITWMRYCTDSFAPFL